MMLTNGSGCVNKNLLSVKLWESKRWILKLWIHLQETLK